MGPDNAKQLSALSDLFKHALDICVPDSVAVLGIAGGNGLEHVNPAIIKRVVGFDINARYLDEVRRRFGTHPNLELHCVDLSECELRVPPVALVHAALFFEDTGLGRALRNALSLVTPGGRLSVVLQLPEHQQQHVTATPYPSMQALAKSFSPVDVSHFHGLLEEQGFRLLKEELRPLPTGKTFWLGIFASAAHSSRLTLQCRPNARRCAVRVREGRLRESKYPSADRWLFLPTTGRCWFDGYSYRSATMGSTRVARRAGM